jgi:arabinofuranan 3-O-arabinosyltransferase
MSAISLPNAKPAGRVRHALELIGFGAVFGYALFLAGEVYSGYWLYDAAGQPIASDFVNVWAAGALTRDGTPAAAYDWTVHRAAEVAAVGHDFPGYYGWHYPPPFLAVAAALVSLPYIPAMLAWLALTLPAYLAAVRAIVGERLGLLLACAFPGALWNVTPAQNGFLTAALLGGMLVNLERRPWLAGMFLGLLTYKPQFGLLFPLVLLFDGRWRVIAAAATTAAVMVAASFLAFGSASWHAFFEWMPITSNAIFGDGRAGLNKLQSLFGVVRWLGGDMTMALLAQGMLIAGATAALVVLNRRCADANVKAAAFAVAALLATPYLYIYDFPVLAIPLAFLMRIGLRGGFLSYELPAIAAASALVLVYLAVPAPTGFAAAVVVAAVIARRAWPSISLSPAQAPYFSRG